MSRDPKPVPLWEALAAPARALVWLLGAAGALSAIQAAQLLAARGHVRTVTAFPVSGVGFRLGSGPIPYLTSLASLAASILWLVWQHRGHSNLRARGVSGLRYTPGWAVGWWFVPVASFVMPYLTMRELWDHAGSGGPEARSSRRPIATWWWTYLAATFVGLGAAGALISSFSRWIRAFATAPVGRPPLLTFTADALRQVYLWSALGGLVRAFAAALAIKVVLDITRREDAMQPGLPQSQGFVPARPDLFAPPG